MSRFYAIVEKQVDIFVEVCQRYITEKGLQNKVWVIKNQEDSSVSIGDPDKLTHNKDFGFVFYYEMIVFKLEDAVNEFKFKFDHFVKTSKLTNRFQAFKNEKESTD